MTKQKNMLKSKSTQWPCGGGYLHQVSTRNFLVSMCHVGVGVLNTLCTDRAAQLTRSPRPNQCLQSDLQARAKVISLFFVNSDGTNLLILRLANKFVCLKDAFAGNKNLIALLC